MWRDLAWILDILQASRKALMHSCPLKGFFAYGADLESLERSVIPGSHDDTSGPLMTRTALSGHVCRPAHWQSPDRQA
jgi:hypothetical protein